MLAAVEAYFAQILKAGLPADVTVTTGPSVGATASEAKLVEVSAERLAVLLPEGSDPTEGRQPAFLTRVHRWSADGAQDSFQLPDDVSGEIIEVESPPGHPLRRGDDFAVDERTLLFYRPPAKADPAVVAHLRGTKARGYQERRPCRIDLFLRAWAGAAGTMDTLLASMLTTGLAAAADLGNVEAPEAGTPGVRLRLLHPVTTLTSISRRTEERAGSTRVFCADIALSVRGELEQVVALGEPPPESLIEKVQGKLIRPPTPDGARQRPLSFRVRPPRR
jgi:hypothetical protein